MLKARRWLLLGLLGLSLGACAHWEKKDKRLAGEFVWAQFFNGGQASYCLKEDGWKERNGILRWADRNGGVALYKAASTGLVLLTAEVAKKHRTTVLKGARGVAFGFLIYDGLVGVKVRW